MAHLRVTPLRIATLRFALAPAYGLPDDHPRAGAAVELPVLAFHLALPGRSVLVDAPAYDSATTPAEYVLPGFEAPPPLTTQLARHGIDAARVTDVILTHAHFDHVAGLVGADGRPSFPNARHLLGRGDWPPDDLGELGDATLGAVRRAGLLVLLEGDVDLGDGLAVVAAPGESPGHQLARAQLGDDVVYAVGDLYHHGLEFDEPERNVVWVDGPAMRASKRALIARAAREEARVLFSHVDGTFRVEGDGAAPRWRRVPGT